MTRAATTSPSTTTTRRSSRTPTRSSCPTAAAPLPPNAVLAPASHLTGTVTGPGGAALAEVSVAALPRRTTTGGGISYEQVSGGWTDELGHYDIGGLPGRHLPHPASATTTSSPTTPPTTRRSGTSTGPASTRATNVTVRRRPDRREHQRAADARRRDRRHGHGRRRRGLRERRRGRLRASTTGTWVSVMQTSTDELGTLRPRRAGRGHLPRPASATTAATTTDPRVLERTRACSATQPNVVVGEATVGGIDAEAGRRRARRRGRSDRRQHRAPDDLRIARRRVDPDRLDRHAGRPGTHGNEFYYDWLRDGSSSTAPVRRRRYVPTAADIGKKIAVLVAAGSAALRLRQRRVGAHRARDSDRTGGHAAAAVTPPVVTPPAPVVDVPTALAKALRPSR